MSSKLQELADKTLALGASAQPIGEQLAAAVKELDTVAQIARKAGQSGIATGKLVGDLHAAGNNAESAGIAIQKYAHGASAFANRLAFSGAVSGMRGFGAGFAAASFVAGSILASPAVPTAAGVFNAAAGQPEMAQQQMKDAIAPDADDVEANHRSSIDNPVRSPVMGQRPPKAKP